MESAFHPESISAQTFEINFHLLLSIKSRDKTVVNV